MSTKKEYTLEELEAQYNAGQEKQDALKKQIEKKRKEVEELMAAQLEIEKDARKKELDEAVARVQHLMKAYMRDYGVYSIASKSDDDIFNSRFWNWLW